MLKIRKSDTVIVLAGKDKGKKGVVLSNLGEKLVIEGVNLAKKHQKPNPAKGLVGGIVEKAMPIHISNVALFNASTGKPDRVGFRFEGDRKVRFYKSTGELIGA
jgi:large subunit ribosomal protein L24